MNYSSIEPEADQIVEIDWADRWEAYRRLQELGISCHCRTQQPLRYKLHDVSTAIQLWSVARSLRVSRPALAVWLEGCWQLHSPVDDYK